MFPDKAVIPGAIRPFSASITPNFPWQDLEHLLKRPKTTYGHMNDWMRMAKDSPGGVPVTVSDTSYQAQRAQEDLDSNYRKTYSDLTSKIAYRYPNPGAPRLRQGRIGGTWRHIKEVLPHGGGRVCYIDGLISVYDQASFNRSLSSQSTKRPHLRAPLNQWEVFPSSELPPISKPPSQAAAPADPDVSRKLSLMSPGKYKGFYRSK